MIVETLGFLLLSLFSTASLYSQVSPYVFSEAQFTTGATPYSIAAGDFNHDGRLDLAVANADSANGSSVSILLGNPDGSFAAKVDYPTGAAPYAVIAADFNGDGKLDLAVAEPNSDTISILFGNGDGTFQSHVDLPVGQGPRSLVAGDFNKDGKVDIAVANQTDNTVSILLGSGGGSFTPPIDYPAGLAPVSIAAADFDADGRLDLAVAGSGGAATLQGKGDGTFQTALFQPVSASGCLAPFSTVSIVAADLNGDGRPDLAVAGTWSGYCPQDNISVLLGNGDGSFQNAVGYSCVRFVSSLIAADLNGDGKPDLVVGSSYGDPQSLSVLLNKGDGTFQSHVDYSAGFAPISVAAGDFNGDGKLDLVTANVQDNDVAVILGNGDGTFQPHSDYAAGNSSQGIAAADFNGDGHPDLATADCGSNTVSLLLNKGDGTFRSRLSFPTGQCPVAIAAADFNRDGIIDLAVANQTDSTVSILLGSGDGTFLARTDYPVAVAPTAIAVADLNGDSKTDVVVLNDGLASVFLGNGDGTFQQRIDSSSGVVFGGSLALGDFNGDGLPDLATTDQSYSGTLAISLGNGDGTFRFVARYTLPFTPDAVAVGDFNRDGKLDLAVAQGTYYGFVSVLLGTGDGSFQAAIQFPTNRNPGSVVTADFDRDGILDLAVGGSSTSILLGNGDGTFQSHMDHVGAAYALTTGDFDGDSRPDLAEVTLSGFVSLLLNKPAAQGISNRPCSGTACDPSNGLYLAPYTQNFTPGSTYSPDGATVSAHVNWNNWPDTIHWAISYHGSAVGSMTGIVGFGCGGATTFDDLCTSNSGPVLSTVSPGELVCIVIDGSASEVAGAWQKYMTQGAPLPSSSFPGFAVCWRNGTLPPSPSISSISPISGTQGQTITSFTVSGTNFDPSASQLSLSPPDGITLVVLSRTATQIVASVGIASGAAIGPRNVVVTNPGGQQSLPVAFPVLPPPQPPTVASISPISGNQGQTVIVTMTGSNFLPGATLYFVGSAQTLTTQTTSVSTDGTSATASVVIPTDASLETKNVVASNIGSLPSPPLVKAFRIDVEQLVFSASTDTAAYEPSLAVDPIHPDHLVVGFNLLTKGPTGAFTLGSDGCAWAESFSGGLTWRSFGSVHAPGKQTVRGDPWVHFGLDGTLFYSCTAVDDSMTSYVYLWSSPRGTGIASASSLDDHPPVAIAHVAANCSKLSPHKGGCSCMNDICTFLDEPSFSIFLQGSLTRLIACWVEARNSTTPGIAEYSNLNIAFSNNYGASWSSRQTLAQPKAFSCRIDGNASRAVVTWLDNRPPSGNQIFADKLFFRSSTDPKLAIWTSPSEVDPTLDPLTDPLLPDGSTTDKVYSRAFAALFSTNSTIRVVWQRRAGGATSTSQVFSRDLFPVSSTPVPLGNPSFEKFLSGGGCGALEGAYQSAAPGQTNATTPFTYDVWLSAGPSDPIFTTGQQFDGTHGVSEAGFPFPRIGEYTSVDCTNTTGWAAWTDLRDGKAEIWVARIPL